MRCSVAIALIAVGCAGRGAVGKEPVVDPNPICLLVGNNLSAWHGLGRIDQAQLPACLGPRVSESTTRFRLMLLASSVHHPPSGGAARVHWAPNGGIVELVEVLPASPPDAPGLVAALGAPASTYVYSAGERAASGLQGESIEEAIWGTRGLALAIARGPAGSARVVRIRGFAAMPAERYVDDFVRFDPEPL